MFKRWRGPDAPAPFNFIVWALGAFLFEIVFLSLNHMLGGRDLPQSPSESARFLDGVAIRYLLWFLPMGLFFSLAINVSARAFEPPRLFGRTFGFLRRAYYLDGAVHGVAFGALWISVLYFGNGARAAISQTDTVPDAFAGFFLGYVLLFLPLGMSAALIARGLRAKAG